MKITRTLSLIAAMAITFSCSKDDPEPSLEKAALSLSTNSKVIEVPAAMTNSQDPYAQMATGWVMLANSMSSNLSLFTPPANAKKSTEVITPVNGRVAGGDAVVYIWSDSQYGSVAYQVRDLSDKFTFELFYKGTNDTGWYRYLYAQELKDRSAGYMILYDAWGFMSTTRNAEIIRWDWSRKGDEFTFKMKDIEDGFNFTVTINTKTKAGSLAYYEGTEKQFEMTWDAQGKGTWKEYEAGQLVDQGTW